MVNRPISRNLAFVGGVVFLVACSDHPESPTAVAPDAAHAAHFMNATTSDVSTLSLEPFTFRAQLDPYHIQQLPDFQVHSKTRSDIVLQRSVFAPGAGPWHTHPGPSFVYVIEGSIKLDRFSEKTGCTETQVYGAGAAYFEIANEVHRAVVVSSESAVLLVTRFNIPVGSPITIPAADPGC